MDALHAGAHIGDFLDATPPHRTPCWFPAPALGNKWFASFGQGFPAPWWASRLRLEAVYTLLLTLLFTLSFFFVVHIRL